MDLLNHNSLEIPADQILTLDGLISSLIKIRDDMGSGQVPVLIFGAVPENPGQVDKAQRMDVKYIIISPANIGFSTVMNVDGQRHPIVGIGQSADTLALLRDDSVEKLYIMNKGTPREK